MFNQASCCTALGGLSCREATSAQRSPGCYLRARVECKKRVTLLLRDQSGTPTQVNSTSVTWLPSRTTDLIAPMLYAVRLYE